MLEELLRCDGKIVLPVYMCFIHVSTEVSRDQYFTKMVPEHFGGKGVELEGEAFY